MASTLQLTSTVLPSGQLEIALVDQTLPPLGAHDVRIEVQATPINPSDIGLLFGAADMRTAVAGGAPGRPVVTATVPAGAMAAMKARVGQSLPVGNEGAGLTIAARVGQSLDAGYDWGKLARLRDIAEIVADRI